MVKSTKFYDLLEIQPGSSDAEIKKAFRKMAVKTHPDKGGDPEVFKEVSRAYEILSDPHKRELYDQYGEEGLEETGHSAEDIFSAFFGGGGGFFGGGGGGSRRPKGPQKGEDVVHPISVTLENLYVGKQSKLAVTRKVKCAKCEGSGSKVPGSTECTTCKGRGFRIITRQMGPMIQQMQAVCSDCGGEGTVIPEKDKCAGCKGKKVISEKKTLELNIDPGMKHGQKITFPGQADEAPGTIPGDIIFVLQQKEHDRFLRKGNDLLITQKIQLVEALCGCQLVVKHLDGRDVLIKTTAGHIIRPGDVMAVHGEGMPVYKNPFEKGQLFIKFEIIFPDSLNASSADSLKSLLPAAPKVNHAADIEECFLHPTDLSQMGQSASHSRGAHDEDDDDEGHGPRVQCAQQ